MSDAELRLLLASNAIERSNATRTPLDKNLTPRDDTSTAQPASRILTQTAAFAVGYDAMRKSHLRPHARERRPREEGRRAPPPPHGALRARG